MTPMEPKSIDRVYWEAAQLNGDDQRRAYLDQACGDNTQLRRRVEELLDVAADASDFLESPPVSPVAGDESPIDEGPGSVIGPYKLLQQIGEGGFGVVFMAEQTQPVQRKVALKIIKPGMDTRQVIARFEAERQALAMMDHPNIAKVFDAGTTGDVERRQVSGVRHGQATSSLTPDPCSLTPFPGRPYFVMELVKGVPITTYCDEKRLSLKQRLELFIPVCQAVQHAHQKGIIHRDLKPTNVLVAEYDNHAVPKVIDFGVAKATGPKLTERTMFTEFGQVIGTVEYMSPEQAKLNQLDVDTRSDIYSLGVLLYELLTGATPLERGRLQGAAFDEMLRIIREEEPLCPSTRLSTLAKGALSTVAERRSVDPRELGQRMRGELDWIVMKCLEKDRDRRYEAANSLALDIQHYLHDEPVLACPPSARYRLSKFARRNRVALMTATLVAAALIVGTVASALLAVRALDAERSADDARAKAEASFQKARQAVDDMYTQVAERWLSQQPQMEPLQREFLTKALQFYAESAQRTGADPAVRFETARAHRRMAEIQHRLGQPVEAESAFRQAIDRLQDLADEIPTEAKYRTELAGALHQRGVLLGDTGQYSDEEAAHRRALAIEQELATKFPAFAEYRSKLGRAHWFVGQVLSHLHRRDEAETEFRSALAIQSKLAAEFPSVPDHRHHLAQTHLRLAQALSYKDRVEEHEQALREAAKLLETLAAEFPTLPAYRNELANVYYWTMRKLPAQQAEVYLRRALALQEKLAAEYPSVTDYRYDLSRSQKNLGDLLAQSDRTEEAEEFYRRALAIAEKLVADAPTVHYYRARQALVKLALGGLLEKTGKPTDAQAAYEQAITLFKSLVDEYPGVWQYSPYLSQAYSKLASLLTAAGRTEDAEVANREAQRHSPEGAASLADVAESFSDETDERPTKLNSQKGETDR
jgi:serine/threonine protein kinase/tetratricopeptide (TPR) repeat protein